MSTGGKEADAIIDALLSVRGTRLPSTADRIPSCQKTVACGNEVHFFVGAPPPTTYLPQSEHRDRVANQPSTLAAQVLARGKPSTSQRNRLYISAHRQRNFFFSNRSFWNLKRQSKFAVRTSLPMACQPSTLQQGFLLWRVFFEFCLLCLSPPATDTLTQ